MPVDPIKLAGRTEKLVAKGLLRKYYRFRSAGFYGGIATADCCGCCLRCVFCWSRIPLEHPERIGHFYTPEDVFHRLNVIAKKHGYSQLRVSGNEPTIGRQHLLHLLELVDGTNYSFILETNGILLGKDASYAREFAKFSNLHVRVSLKGCDPQQFSQLTGAGPEAFDLQLAALHNLLDAGVSCHAAVMYEFAPKEKLEGLRQRLASIDQTLADGLEFEYLIPFPHVIQKLARLGIHLEGERLREAIAKNY